MSALTDYLEFRAMACPEVCRREHEKNCMKEESAPRIAATPKRSASFFAAMGELIADLLKPRRPCVCNDGPKSPYDHIAVKGLLG